MERQFVEIAFRQAGELFLFDAGELALSLDDRVVVETEHGQALGTVKSVKDSSVSPPNNFKLYRVVRVASSEDIGREQRHQRKEKEAYEYCNQKIGELGLPMKLIRAEYFFSGSKLLFYFSAEGRVDFRLLVRDLARYFQKRIEMRQIGVRDSAKLIGGVGPCGQQLCCNRFLRQFSPVSIRMAKDQSLPLNPQKVSGVCGRLMCCLAYEQGMYQTMRKRLPRVGEDVQTEKGIGKVRDVHPLQETVRVVFLQNDPPTEEELHISALPEFRDRPLPDKMPLNMGSKSDKGNRGKRRSRRGLEPLMEPRQPGRSTSGRGRPEKGKGKQGHRNERQDRNERHDRNEQHDRNDAPLEQDAPRSGRNRQGRKRKPSRERQPEAQQAPVEALQVQGEANPPVVSEDNSHKDAPAPQQQNDAAPQTDNQPNPAENPKSAAPKGNRQGKGKKQGDDAGGASESQPRSKQRNSRRRNKKKKGKGKSKSKNKQSGNS